MRAPSAAAAPLPDTGRPTPRRHAGPVPREGASELRGACGGATAERLGIAQQTLAHYEGGRVRLTIDMLLDLADELGTSVTELIGEPAHLLAKPGPASRLQQQVDAISQLPRSKQKLASDLLDTVLAR
ncbi:helix-turn-helix domain-containing protein [Burkholderia cepacia]|nr:helix-turn-helix transcriptional regulator [Burkholderia cepacia]